LQMAIWRFPISKCTQYLQVVWWAPNVTNSC
jgi:hypothetical protein